MPAADTVPIDSDAIREAPGPLTTFAARYCAHHRLPDTAFVPTVLARTLHAPARWFTPTLLILFPRYLEADLECIRFCGQLSGKSELVAELHEFTKDPCNHTLRRGLLRQRLSTRRLKHLLHKLPESDTPGLRKEL